MDTFSARLRHNAALSSIFQCNLDPDHMMYLWGDALGVQSQFIKGCLMFHLQEQYIIDLNILVQSTERSFKTFHYWV